MLLTNALNNNTGRRIKVSGAGDPEFNGIYFCTGCNGNGFLFTKPRTPERRVPGCNRNFGHAVVGQAPIVRANIEGHENPIENPVRDGAANAAMEDDEDDSQRDGGVSLFFYYAVVLILPLTAHIQIDSDVLARLTFCLEMSQVEAGYYVVLFQSGSLMR